MNEGSFSKGETHDPSPEDSERKGQEELLITERETGESTFLDLSSHCFDEKGYAAVDAQVDSLLAKGKAYICLNLANVDDIDEAGLAGILELVKKLRREAGCLTLSSPSPKVQELFDISQLSRMFSISLDDEGALNSLNYDRKHSRRKPKARPVEEPEDESVGDPEVTSAAGHKTEGQVEREKNITVTVIFRGDNPFMHAMAEGLSQEGFTVTTRSLPNDILEAPGVTEDSPEHHTLVEEKIREAIGDVEGTVVSDQTLYRRLETVLGPRVIDAYESIGGEWAEARNPKGVARIIRPIVEELESQGRTAVTLTYGLGDHIRHVFKQLEISEAKMDAYKKLDSDAWLLHQYHIEPGGLKNIDTHEEDGWGLAALYAGLLQQELKLPFISRKEFTVKWNAPTSNIVEVLEKRGFDPKKVVLLVDHHVYHLATDNMHASGMDEVDIVPICPCCKGMSKMYTGKLQERGFKVLSLENRGDTTQALQHLMKRLETAPIKE